jgi:hypothetical protein
MLALEGITVVAELGFEPADLQRMRVRGVLA